MVEVLDQLVGSYGVTTDKEFGKIVDTLLEVGRVVQGQERPSHQAELIIQKFEVATPDGKTKCYDLWYQTRTPFSPKEMCCSFGFEEADRKYI